MELDNSASHSSCIFIARLKRKPLESCEKMSKGCQKLSNTFIGHCVFFWSSKNKYIEVYITEFFFLFFRNMLSEKKNELSYSFRLFCRICCSNHRKLCLQKMTTALHVKYCRYMKHIFYPHISPCVAIKIKRLIRKNSACFEFVFQSTVIVKRVLFFIVIWFKYSYLLFFFKRFIQKL